MRTSTYVQVLCLVAFSVLIISCGSQVSSPPKSSSHPGSSLSPISTNAPTGYLARGTSYVLFIQYTQTGNTMTGEWNEVYVVSNNYGTLQVNSFHTNFDAGLNGKQFNLSVNGHTYAGYLDKGSVVIEFPQNDGTLMPITLTSASISDYNDSVTTLQGNVDRENQSAISANATATSVAATATVISDEQSKLDYDLANIGDAIKQLNSDSSFESLFNDYTSNLNQMQRDYQTEQNDAKGGCSNVSQVGADVSQIAADNSQTSANDSQFVSDNSQVSSDLSNLQGFIDKIEQHWNNLGKSSPTVTQNDIDTAIHNGNAAIQNTQSAISSANSKVHGYDATSQQILQQAENLYNSMHC